MTDSMRRSWTDRIALAALCLLLALSIAVRVWPAGGKTREPEAAGSAAAVDLGDGVVLTRGATVPRDVLIGACWAPIPVAFVEPSPHGTDTSLAGSRNAGERAIYAYHGWILSGRFAATKLTILHFARRGASILHLSGTGGRDALAVKLTMPAGCDATPEEALAALRRDVQANW